MCQNNVNNVNQLEENQYQFLGRKKSCQHQGHIRQHQQQTVSYLINKQVVPQLCKLCISYLVLLSASEHGPVDFRFLTNTRYVFQKQVHGGTVDQNTAVVCGETHAFCLFSKIVLMIKTKYLYKNTKNICIPTKILFNSDDCNSCYLIFFQFLRRTSSILLFIILIHNTFVNTQ